MTASIKLTSVSVDFPELNAGNVSLKNTMIETFIARKTSKKLSVRNTYHALDKIDLQIKSGERVGIIGQNGSGKTTLLRVLAGIHQPTSGSLDLIGKTVPLISYDLGVNMEASGLENIILSGVLLGLNLTELKSKLPQIVEFSGLGEAIHQPVRTYSSGMRMRLAFSLSTSVRPQILLLDEWLSVGDEAFQKKAQSRMNELVDSSEIIVLSSHSRDIIENVCSRVILMENGHVRADGNPKQICDIYFDGRSDD